MVEVESVLYQLLSSCEYVDVFARLFDYRLIHSHPNEPLLVWARQHLRVILTDECVYGGALTLQGDSRKEFSVASDKLHSHK